MENIEFLIAKNGEKTCKIGQTFLHSSYNPNAEAQRFVNSITCDFNPEFVLIAEPCLSYCTEYLRKRFPKSKIIALRYANSFNECNSLFDGVAFFLENENRIQFESQLQLLTGEDGLCSSLFLSWTPACNYFSEINRLAWESIKNLTLKGRALLFTKGCFSKRWIKNSVNFIKNVRKTCTIKKIDIPIVITASGPSLKKSLPYLQKFREKYFLLCVSSALNVLLKENLVPDLVISTDGGYWAKEHLSPLCKNKKNAQDFSTIPLALSAESACQKNIFQNNPILPLAYNDGFESEILKIWAEETKTPLIQANRNGTVSGTAMEFALSYTSKNVYACGLDLFPGQEYQHTQPNILEKNAAQFDFKLKNLETRQIKSKIGSVESLKIYENWFSENSAKFQSHFFRLSDNFSYKNKLGKIRDVNFSDFEAYLSNLPIDKEKPCEKKCLFEEKNTAQNDTKNALAKTKDFILKKSQTEEWLRYTFPTDFLLYKKNINPNQEKSMYDEILKKNQDFVNYLIKMCDYKQKGT